MKMNRIKSIFCLILCALLVLSFTACKAKPSGKSGVDVVEKLNSLTVSDKTLGIAGKYAKLSDIRDGSIDKDLVGTWTTADGDMTYIYGEDGVLQVKSETYGDSEMPFTCLTVGGYKILCEEMELSSEFYDGAQEGDTQLSYTAYSVENDALYQVIVEEVNEDFTSSMSALVTLYRADDTGSAAAAIAKNPIDLQSLNGTWTSEKGSFTIEDGTLTLGEDSFDVSVDAQNRLVVEKDGQSTAYNMAVSSMKEYDYEDRTQFTASTALGVSFTGADENDKPNLLSVLDDYKTEYDYDSWYYSGSFKLQEDDGDMEFDNLFQKGVWSASVDGKVEMYFVFYDETSGRTERADGTGGAPFTCEQSGWDIVFHFGSADDVTNAKFSEGDNTGTFDFGEKQITYTFESVPDADADNFEVPAQDDGDMEFDNLFQKGVWAASIDGKIDTYFVFYDEANGRTERADGTGGVPFTCEQSGWDIVFHFGSADDVTNAKFSEGDNTGTFDYDGKTVVYTFEAVQGADADTFEVPAE
ncbi:MAG: hypothetical protein IKW76_06945 [Clostridia bacterium]|nr:hypothetical protein [Clostridia bacterium]